MTCHKQFITLLSGTNVEAVVTVHTTVAALLTHVLALLQTKRVLGVPERALGHASPGGGLVTIYT